MQGEIILDLCGSVFVCCVSEKNIAIGFIEPDTSKKAIETIRSYNERHPGGNGLILNKRKLHRSPGHHSDRGSLAEIFVARSAIRWLRL